MRFELVIRRLGIHFGCSLIDFVVQFILLDFIVLSQISMHFLSTAVRDAIFVLKKRFTVRLYFLHICQSKGRYVIC